MIDTPDRSSDVPPLDAVHGQCVHLGAGRSYRLLRPLAPRASTGAVWSAHWLQANASVALKWLPPDVPRSDRTAQREALRREMAALRQCQHPHLVRLLTVGRLRGDEPVLVLEQLHEPLHHRLMLQRGASGGLPLVEALRLTHQLAQALQALHGCGWRHLDVKPANLLLTRPGPLGQRLKLADLGACTPLAQTTHQFLGTPGWMAPEQCQPLSHAPEGAGTPNFGSDARTDVFAVGQVLHYLLTGQGSAWARQAHAAAQSGALVGLVPEQTSGCALSRVELQRVDTLWCGELESSPLPGSGDLSDAGATTGSQPPNSTTMPTWIVQPPAATPRTAHPAHALPAASDPTTTRPPLAANVGRSPLGIVMRHLCALDPQSRYSGMQAVAQALQHLRLGQLEQQRSARCAFSGNKVLRANPGAGPCAMSHPRVPSPQKGADR